MKELICICCPQGCHLTVDEENDFAVTGNSCERGAEYGRTESMVPVRVLTSTVTCLGGKIARCPVKTKEAIPKGKIFEAEDLIRNTSVKAPVMTGQVIIRDIAGSGVDLIATKTIGC